MSSSGGSESLEVSVERRKTIKRFLVTGVVLILILSLLIPGCRQQWADQDLINAAYSGDLAYGKEALANGANVNARHEFDESETAMSIAMGNGHIEFVRFLISRGAKLEIDGDGCHRVLMNVQGPKQMKLRKWLESVCESQKRKD